MNRYRLRARERVEIRVPNDEDISIFEVRVYEETDEGTYLEQPVIDRKDFHVEPGMKLQIEFKRADAIYRFTAQVLDLVRRDGIPLIRISQPREVVRVQRRQHFRIDILLPVRYREFITDQESEGISEFREGVVLNLSAGGIRFTIPTADTLNIWPGTTLELELTLSDDLDINGVIVRVLQINPDRGDSSRSVITARFVEILEKDQEAIISHNIRYQTRWRTESKQ